MSVAKIKAQLLSRIDTNDLMEVKKVNRYCELLELDIKCQKAIEEEGVSIVIENGSQRFVKSHPSINDRLKLNAQLIALEKSIIFKPEEKEDSNGGGLI